MNQDQEKLLRFVDDIHLLLSFVTVNEEVFFPRHLRRFVSPAWERVQQRIRQLRSSIEVDSRYMNLSPELEAHGLTDAELDLKLANFNHGMTNFRPTLQAGQIDPNLPASEKSVLRARTHKKLKMGNIVLGSLPGWVAGAINEFKMVAEQAIEDVENPERTSWPSVVPKGT